MEELTARQSEILRLVRQLTEVSGYPPTRAEIAARMGFRSVNAAEQHLRALEKKGAIEISSGASRGIRVRDSRHANRPGRLLELPVVGRVAAGSPILAEEHLQGRYQVDPNLFTRAPITCCACAACRCATPASSRATCSPCTARRRHAAARSWWRGWPTK